MSGPKKDKVKLTEQGLVTREAMLAYLHDELAAEDRQELEKLLQQDPFATDAMEGLQSSTNQTALTASITSLSKKVNERTGLKERKSLKLHWVTYAWVAVLIVLLIGIGFLMVNYWGRANHSLPVNDKKENQPAPVTAPIDTAAVSKNPNLGLKDSVAHTQTVSKDTAKMHGVVNSTGKPGNAQVKNTPAPARASSTTAPVKPLPAVKPADTKSTAMTEKVTTGSSPGSNNKNTAAPAAKPEATKKEEKPGVKDLGILMDNAKKSFVASDYNTAGDDYDRVIKSDPDNADALYFGGICDYINGKTSKSENSFDRLLKKGDKYIDGAKWYKANILIKKGKSDAAKVLLQDLSNGSSPYKERAIKKLAEMGF